MPVFSCVVNIAFIASAENAMYCDMVDTPGSMIGRGLEKL